MFTGLVEGTGEIKRLVTKGPDAVLTVRPPWDLAEAVLGESVAVSGACLTVTGVAKEGFTLDVSAETLSRTKLGDLKQGNLVNLERAMRLGDRLGGHLVSGHVDSLGRVASIRRVGGSFRVEVEIPPEHLAYVVEKGSVTVDGISLTVNEVSPRGFSLNIIPHTFEVTTLKLVRVGDSVNIETDLIGKYVARLLNRDQGPGGAKGSAGGAGGRGGGLTAADLARMGY